MMKLQLLQSDDHMKINRDNGSYEAAALPSTVSSP